MLGGVGHVSYSVGAGCFTGVGGEDRSFSNSASGAVRGRSAWESGSEGAGDAARDELSELGNGKSLVDPDRLKAGVDALNGHAEPLSVECRGVRRSGSSSSSPKRTSPDSESALGYESDKGREEGWMSEDETAPDARRWRSDPACLCEMPLSGKGRNGRM